MAGKLSRDELRQRYNAATRAFLVRDYTATASTLHDALARCPRLPPSAWFDELRDAGVTLPLEEIRRRLEILQITFLATVRSSPAALSPASNLTPLLDLPPAKLVKALWKNLISTDRQAVPSVEVLDSEDDILPTPSAAYLHPSLAVSLALAALKLDEPRLARAIAEAWFGSVSEDVERMVWETSGTVDWEGGEFSLDGVGGLGASSMLGAADKQKPDGRKQLVGPWLKLLDLVVLHVLPKLGEWEAAGDFVRLQGQENGGWVPDQRVEATLHRLAELQQEEVQLAAARVQRQKDLELAKQKRASEARRSSDKGKERTRDSSSFRDPPSSGSSGPSSPTKASKQPRSKSNSPRSSNSPKPSPSLPYSSSSSAPSSFAGMRDSLSSYLSHSPSPPAPSHPPRQRSSPLSSFVSYLRNHYSTDPVRLLSIICFIFAFMTWARRRMALRRARGQGRLGVLDAMRLAAAKVGETIGMATKITAL
ncbi:hypothetical protein Rt10032_c06g2794 [Rhodotorula toruloides]|uniref:Uncharacterized protein n=1 Tax=Rhodotorula toruloides TaxID=5286 RepID=A0A511KEH6_RHOTO|nr:hypothetical protein Rt10032_c06g2794 [Rhodotorula toruloides]